MENKYFFIGKETKYKDLDLLQKNKADWLADSGYSDSTKRSYWMHLKSVRPAEKKKCKDLCWFTKEEIEEFIRTKETEREAVKKSLYSVIKHYISHCYRIGIISYNPCNDIDTKGLFKLKQNKYITLDEFYTLIDSLEMSDIDRMLLTLIRYGVDTKSVGRVKWTDLDSKCRTLKVESLTLPIDERFIDRVRRAKACTSYHDKVDFIDKGFMIKTSKNCTWTCIPIEQVNNKINNISTFNNINRFPTRDIQVSREYDLLFNLLTLNNKVTFSDYRRILAIYNENVTQSKVTRLKTLFESVSGVKTSRQ